MGNVIKKTANSHGTYRYIRHVNLADYPTADWLHDPDLTAVVNVLTKYWKVSGSSVVEMTQLEKDAVDLDIAERQAVATSGTFGFEKSGNVKNKWLGFGASKSSDQMPYIIPNPLNITAITFVNQKNGCDTDIRIYRNGTLIHTWEVRDKRYAWTTTGLSNLSFSPGDRLGIYLKDRGEDAKHVIVTIHYSTWSHEVGEGGASSL